MCRFRSCVVSAMFMTMFMGWIQSYVGCGEDVLDGLGNLGTNTVTLDHSNSVLALDWQVESAQSSFSGQSCQFRVVDVARN